MNARIRAYVLSLLALAIAVAYSVYMLDPRIASQIVKAAAVFAALSAVCEMLAYQKSGSNETGSIAFLPMLASVVVAPSWVTIVGVAAATGVAQVTNRRTVIKSVFNIVQASLWVGVAIVVYRLLGGESLLLKSGANLPGLIAIVLIFGLLNSGAVAGAIAVSEGVAFWSLWWTRARVTIFYDLITMPGVYAFAYCYAQWGAIGATFLVIPSLIIRSLYKVNWELEKTNQELLQLMVAAIEARDPYTSGHSRRVARNSRLIAQAIGLPQKQVDRIAVAALLHDVGKIHEIFAPILSKPGRLTAEENAIMQTHPIKSEELVRTVSQLKDVVAPIRHHHENWDGTGYPDGLVGESIPLASRIIMFADTIDAMTTDRPYRAALTEGQVRAEFVKLKGRQFDPQICDTLLSSPIYPKLFDQDVPLTPAIAEKERRKTASTPLLAS